MVELLPFPAVLLLTNQPVCECSFRAGELERFIGWLAHPDAAGALSRKTNVRVNVKLDLKAHPFQRVAFPGQN